MTARLEGWLCGDSLRAWARTQLKAILSAPSLAQVTFTHVP
jgi:hypothetical protein